MCRPPNSTRAGTLHALRNRDATATNFEWTGDAWSTPGTGWSTKPGFMSALGWRYVGPANGEVKS